MKPVSPIGSSDLLSPLAQGPTCPRPRLAVQPPFLKVPSTGEQRGKSFPVDRAALASVNDNTFPVGD